VLAWLKRHGSKRNRDGMARYGLPSDNAFGVTMAAMKGLARRLGRNHDLAAALWDTGWYEARILTSFVDDPACAAFALLWGLTVHDKQAEDTSFIKGLAVNMSLRAIGKRNPELNDATLTVARRLAASQDATARWVGKDAIRELTSASVTQRLHGAT
jgi:3-methyladenine DNA glycosylase AlkD